MVVLLPAMGELLLKKILQEGWRDITHEHTAEAGSEGDDISARGKEEYVIDGLIGYSNKIRKWKFEAKRYVFVCADYIWEPGGKLLGRCVMKYLSKRRNGKGPSPDVTDQARMG